MIALRKSAFLFTFLAVVPVLPARATVQILSMTSSISSPQLVGTTITWSVKATDSNPGTLMFRFNISPPGRPFALVRDFNVGTQSGGVWSPQPFAWTPTGIEGIYEIQVTAKDFQSGESASSSVKFQINPLVLGSNPIVVATANPLVALFSAPSCAAGSSMRVAYQPQSKTTPVAYTNWVGCHPPTTMTFQVAGMYPSMAYYLYAQTLTGSKITNGPNRVFTTGALPSTLPFPNFRVLVPAGLQTDTADSIILHNLVQLGGGTHYPDVATDLAGNIMWYYYSSNAADLLTRPLKGGGVLSIQAGQAWQPISPQGQILRQLDLAGNVIRETNTGVIQQELIALGNRNAGSCLGVSSPPTVGAACLSSFHHDAIQFTIGNNQYTAVIGSIEKIFPPGTQGDTSGLLVDVIGDIIIVLDSNWQVVWYFDTFEHDGGGTQLDINRPAVMGETCVTGQTGCPPVFLLSSATAPKAKDWLHANSLYYWPKDGSIVFSLRHQDWILKINYNNGTGDGNVLWRMGPGGDFTFLNNYNDPWPWFSHQHDAGVENNGTGVMTIFDNGNTRVSPAPLGLGTSCGPADCNSRGMALSLNEAEMQVTPVLSADLGVYGAAMGSAQLLSNGNYYFLPPNVLVTLNFIAGYSIEIYPTPGTASGFQVLNLGGPEHYRGWQMQSLYSVPTT